MPERIEVQRAVAASAGEIFAVLKDPQGHVAIDSSGMLMQASGDPVAKAGELSVVRTHAGIANYQSWTNVPRIPGSPPAA